jgi:hypothetical protein
MPDRQLVVTDPRAALITSPARVLTVEADPRRTDVPAQPPITAIEADAVRQLDVPKAQRVPG